MESKYVIEFTFSNGKQAWIAADSFSYAEGFCQNVLDHRQTVEQAKVLFRKTNRCLRKFVR